MRRLSAQSLRRSARLTIKDLWSKVLAVIESDEAQNARIQQLEDEVAALKAAAGAQTTSGGQAGAHGGSSTPLGDDADRPL